jgi:hypothetical protein
LLQLMKLGIRRGDEEGAEVKQHSVADARTACGGCRGRFPRGLRTAPGGGSP